MELIDCHSHTALSGHGQGTIHEAVCRADELGLSCYAQTEHLMLPEHLDPHYHVSMRADLKQKYIETLTSERQRLLEQGSKMELIIGTEADWLNGRADELKELCRGFEYIILSVHYLDEWPFDDPKVADQWEVQGVDAVWKRYFEVWLEMAASDAPVSCFGHPDLPKKFAYYPSFNTHDYFADMAAAAAKKGCMVEVNTAGLRKPVGELYPCLDLLKAFCQAKVPCTVGCDAHRPQDIGVGVEEAYAWMKQAGYKQVTVPRPDGDRRTIKLED